MGKLEVAEKSKTDQIHTSMINFANYFKEYAILFRAE